MKNLDTFCQAMEKHLRDCVTEMPETYAWPISEVPAVMVRMRAALERGSYNKDSPSFKRTCKELGIKHTYSAINAFLRG